MARVRKAKADHTPEKHALAPSGWCITHDHNLCKRDFTYSTCNCSCHGAVKAPAASKRVAVSPVAKKATVAVRKPVAPKARVKRPLIPRKGG